MWNFLSCKFRYFHEASPFHFKSTYFPFHLDFKPCMHFIINLDDTMVYGNNYHLPIFHIMNISSPNYFALDPQKLLEILIPMGEVLTPLLINGWVLENAYIMERPKVTHVNVNKQSMMVQTHDAIHCIYFLLGIKP